MTGSGAGDAGGGSEIVRRARSSSPILSWSSASVLAMPWSIRGSLAAVAREDGKGQAAPAGVPPSTSTAMVAASVGVLPTRTPRCSSASALAAAVPELPEMIAPA